MKGIPFVLAAAFALAAFGESEDFSRYESIVERQMFGQPPDGFDPTKKPSEVKAANTTAQKQVDQELARQQQKLKSAIRFSMINVIDGNTMVGFSDSSNPKEPKNYYLKVGESSADGWMVKSADPETAKMVIVKGDLEVEISLGGDSSKGAGQTTARSAGPAPGALAGDRPLPARSNTLSGRRETRFRRQQDEIAALREQVAATMAEQKKLQAEREAELKAEREAEQTRREAEKAAQAEERAQNRQKLEAMAQELKKNREAREKAEAEGNSAESADGEAQDVE